MNIFSRTMTGALITLSGAILIVLGIKQDIVALMYGIPLCGTGILIFFNKKEDQIEQIHKK